MGRRPRRRLPSRKVRHLTPDTCKFMIGQLTTQTASQAQNLPAPVTPVTQMIPAVPETPPKPTDSAAQKPVLPTMELDSDEPFTTRWDLAIQNLDDESVRMLIRACFYGGRTIPLSFVVRRQYLVGNTARTLYVSGKTSLARCLDTDYPANRSHPISSMRDLGFIARRFKLASIGFPVSLFRHLVLHK